MKQAGHVNPNTHGKYYAPNDSRVDGQGTFFRDEERRTDITDLFRASKITRNPEL
jgi:hypothetical protein